MGRKKKPSGKHATPRKPIMVPVDWLALGHKLAAEDEKPLLWYVLKRWAEEAKAKGIEHPKLPWIDRAQEADEEAKPKPHP